MQICGTKVVFVQHIRRQAASASELEKTTTVAESRMAKIVSDAFTASSRKFLIGLTGLTIATEK